MRWAEITGLGGRRLQLLGGLAAILCLFAGVSVSARAAEPSLKFGVYPYLTPQRMVTAFSPLRDLMRDAAGRPVELQTAPGYQVFHEQAVAGDHDVVMTPSHLGRILERDRGFQRIAMTRYQVHALLVVRNDSPVRQLADLRGRTLAIPGPLSLLHALVLEHLRIHGLQPGRDVTLRVLDTSQNSIAAPLRGDADVGTAGAARWHVEGPRDQMRVIAETRDAPGFVLLAHPRVPAAAVQSMHRAVLSFHRSPAGQRYFALTGHEQWLAVDAAAMKRADAYRPAP